jgi:hypothetical protein
MSEGRETGGRARIGWTIAYSMLWAAFLLAASLNMLRVPGGFLTSYLADLAVPPLLYVGSRGLVPTKRRSGPALMRWLGSSPERAALSLFLASSATELSQMFWPTGFFAGRFDPWDLVAYGAGLSACYGFDKLEQVRAPVNEDVQTARH